jgi:N-acetylmuramoyl-L-alanine amidase
LLRDCLESGEIVRCQNATADPRATLDVTGQLGSRATVLVPLRGRGDYLGVLQAFSTAPWAFNDQDVRSLDLFAELVLAALRPQDQDRRLHWLSNVAEEVLQNKPSATPNFAGIADSDAGQGSDGKGGQQPTKPEFSTFEEERPDQVPLSNTLALNANVGRNVLASRPGLSVVMALVAVAALFSAGVWWGMQVHDRENVTKSAPARGAQTTTASSPAPPTLTTPSAPEGAPVGSDNLMDPAQPASQNGALVPVPDNKLAALPKITGVRHWSSSMGSTVVIDMEDQVPYEVHRLMSPERIYFDLHDTELTRELAGKTMEVGDSSLSKVRVAQPVAGVTRIVLDTKDGSNFSVSMESNPYRLVVELHDSGKTVATNRPKPLPPSAWTAMNSDQPLPAKTGKLRIILDPGHGGWDLGTVGRQGLLEKDLVLDVTRRLGKLLREQMGSEVMFTRGGDEYLPLDQRADFANQAQGDLFVSVHANYSNSANARGVETYYTNLFSAPGSREVEKHADGTIVQTTPVSLSPGSLHEKIEESRRLAASVQRSLYATLAAKSPDIRDRGIKDSAFAVLTGTTMPAILTEISFVSSPADEHNLQSEAYRQQIAEALYTGIARYQESSPRSKVAQLHTEPHR